MAPRLTTSIKRLALAGWVVAMIFVGAGLLSKHALALPVPARSVAMSAALGGLRTERGTWFAVHVLYAECRCSQRIVSHLLSSTRPQGASEVVLWVGKAEPSAALVQKFRVVRLTNAELARLGIEDAPLFIVLDPEDHVRYSGGYTSRKQGPAIEEQRLFDEARRGVLRDSLPVFGCVFSERLKQALGNLPTF